MKNKEQKQGKNRKKFIAALALGILAISGFAIGISAIDDNIYSNNPSYGVFKEIKNNPLAFIKAEKIALPPNFDYIQQMNNEFVQSSDSSEKMSLMPGDSLKAVKEEINKIE